MTFVQYTRSSKQWVTVIGSYTEIFFVVFVYPNKLVELIIETEWQMRNKKQLASSTSTYSSLCMYFVFVVFNSQFACACAFKVHYEN